MKILCLLFGHDTNSKMIDQPNPKVVKIRMFCPRCDKQHGMFTWPNLTYREAEKWSRLLTQRR